MWPFMERAEFAENMLVPQWRPTRPRTPDEDKGREGSRRMNALEHRMVEALADLRENHHVSGVKAEFEAEGTRLEEALRLKEVVSQAGLGLTIKIGGCEAVRDMYEARVIGVQRVVGPMVESPHALRKYLAAVRLAFPADERDDVEFCVNIETVTGVREVRRDARPARDRRARRRRPGPRRHDRLAGHEP